MIESLGISSASSGDEKYKITLSVRGTGPVDLSLAGQDWTTLHVKGLKADETEGAFQQPPVWTVDRADIITLTPTADGINCRIDATNPIVPGTAIITVTVPDVQPVTVNITVTVSPITHLQVNIDPPQSKTPA